MKQLVKKLLLFSFLIFLVGIGLSFFLPANTYWGNPEYTWKIHEYKKNDYNAVWFGTSRIYRGIDPLLFDSLVNKTRDTPMKSYNLATHASWASETFYLYEAFLKDPALSGNVKVVFMEFQNIMSIRPGRLGSEKSIYYQNPAHYWFMLRYSFFEVIRDPKKIVTSVYSIGVYSLSTLLNVASIKRVNVKLNLNAPEEVESINERGYLGFPDLVMGAVTDESIAGFTGNITEHLAMHDEPYNPAYYDQILELIRQSEQKGIKLIFVLPPVRLTPGMIAVFSALPEKNKIEVCDPAKFPELYEVKNWIDPVHLNAIGSQHLTNSVSNQFLSK